MRSTKEWIGKTDDTPVPPRVKDRIVKRQGGMCAGIHDGGSKCGAVFGARVKPEFDHRPALCNGGENRESKIFALCHPCHAKLFPGDMAEKSKIADIRKKHLGLKTPKKPWPKRQDPWGKEWRARQAS